MIKIMLYRSGERGKSLNLPCYTTAEEELSMILGGAVCMTPLADGLTLVTLDEAQKLRLPLRYVARAVGDDPEPVAGDAVIVRVNTESGSFESITNEDKEKIIEQHLLEPLRI